MLALPIFPASHPASIFGEHELNFCVRYGNRWTLMPINTNYKLRKDKDLLLQVFVLALSIFPASHPASIVDEYELNFCVRDGNRWTLVPISTNYMGYTLKTEHQSKFTRMRDTLEPAFLPIVGQALGLLVSVSYTPYSASTSDLSTS